MTFVELYNEGWRDGWNITENTWNESAPVSTEELLQFCNEARLKCSSNLDLREPQNRGRIDGMFSFIFDKEIENLNIDDFNDAFKELDYSYEYEDSLYLIIDKLLEDNNGRINIPPERRPRVCYLHQKGYSIEGTIGSIFRFGGVFGGLGYDIFDEDNPEDDLNGEEGCYLVNCITRHSEVLKAVQSVVDPEYKNNELSLAIERCITIEQIQSSTLFKVLASCRLPVIKLKGAGVRYFSKNISGDISHIYLMQNGSVYADIESEGIEYGCHEVPILPTALYYNFIVAGIRDAVRKAKEPYL